MNEETKKAYWIYICVAANVNGNRKIDAGVFPVHNHEYNDQQYLESFVNKFVEKSMGVFGVKRSQIEVTKSGFTDDYTSVAPCK